MSSKKEQKKYHHISNVARIYNIHPQTLRLYEREGLLKPSRSEGNTRLYSDEDLRQLEFILSLTRDLGVNLAGIEVIINMRKKMDQIEAEVNEFLEYIRKEFFEGKEDEFESRKKAIVKISPARIIKIDQPNQEEGIIFFQIDRNIRAGDILEPAAFQFKRIVEFVISERLLFYLEPKENGVFFIQVAGNREIPPILEISLYSKEAILIKVLERSLVWSLGYQFNVPEILKRILQRLKQEIKK